jgi:competence protein ComEC
VRLFWLGLIWLTGIAIGRFLNLSAGSFLIGAGLGILLATVGQDRLRMIGLGAAVFFLGAWRLAVAVPNFDSSHISAHNDSFRIATLTGVISDFPDTRDDYIGLRIRSDSIRYSDSEAPQSLTGNALVRADRFSSFSYGDRVEALGILETPPEFEDFSYRDYLARQGIFSLIANASVTTVATGKGNPILHLLFGLRQRALDTLYSIFPDPEASLLAGILLGIESGISSDVREAFNDTSTTHIIAISGFNITILAALVISLTGRTLGMRRGAIVAAIVIAFYTILVGADASVVRAAIMGGLVLFARFLGRLTLALASLSAAAIVMTLVNPFVLWDVGFQLSFAATLGLVLYAEPIKDWFVKTASRWMETAQAKRISTPVGEFILFTFAAQITTLPLTAYHFQRLSLVSFVANPIVLPAQPPLMILGGLATLAGMIWLPLGQFLAWLAWPFPAFTIRVVDLFASVPSAAIDLRPISFPVLITMYILLFGITALLRERRFSLPAPSLLAILAAISVVVVLTWKAVADRPDGRVHVTAFESGGTLIETADGRYVLVGGGDSPTALTNSLGRKLPLFHRRIDWLIVPDRDIAGLAGIPVGYEIGVVMTNTEPPDGALAGIIQTLQARGARVVRGEQGIALDLGAGTRLELIDNEGGNFTLLLTSGKARFALMPKTRSSQGFPRPELTSLTGIILPDSSSISWLQAIDVMVVVVDGPNPLPLNTTQPKFLATEERGWIELTTDGENLWLLSQR